MGRGARARARDARGAWTSVALGMCVAMASCAPEEKVTRYKPFFAGLEGAETREPAVFDRPAAEPAGRADASEPSAPVGSDAEAQERAREDAAKHQVRNKDGSIKLISKSGVHLMGHIERCLRERDAKLFASQVLCAETVREFRERGLDPQEALAMLLPHERDINKLFARLPMGEHTPSAIAENVGRNVRRVRLDDQTLWTMRNRETDQMLKYRGFDMVLEGGNWRLRWLIER